MNDANGQLKSRSKTGFPMKGSMTSPIYFSRQWVEVLNCLLDLESENRQKWMMLDMNSKWNKCKNISSSNWNRVRVREKAIANIKDLFRSSSTKLYVGAFTTWRISLSTKNLFTKKVQGLHKIRVHNSNSQSSTREVA